MRKIPAQNNEHNKRNDLQYQTSHHDMNPHLLHGVRGCTRGFCPAQRLEYQGHNIADDEGDGICAWLESCQILAENDNDAGQAEVDGCREEGRANGEGDEIPGCQVRGEEPTEQRAMVLTLRMVLWGRD